MYNNEIFFAAKTQSDKKQLIKFLVNEMEGIASNLCLSIENKGYEISVISVEKIEEMVNESIFLEVHSDTPIFTLGYTEEYFGKEFELCDEDKSVLNVSNSWRIYGNIIQDKIVNAIEDACGLAGGDTTLNIDDGGEFYFEIAYTNKGQMEKLMTSCGVPCTMSIPLQQLLIG